MTAKDRILEVVQQIVEEGGKVTQNTVRERLGSGSIATIAPILKQWREQQQALAALEPMPEAPRKHIEEALQKVWRDAMAEAALRWERQKVDMEEVQQNTLEELQETLETAQALEKEAEVAREALKSAEAALAEAEAARAEAAAETREVQKQLSELAARLSEMTGRHAAMQEIVKTLKPVPETSAEERENVAAAWAAKNAKALEERRAEIPAEGMPMAGPGGREPA